MLKKYCLAKQCALIKRRRDRKEQ